MRYFAPRHFAPAYFGWLWHEGTTLPGLPTHRSITPGLRRTGTTATVHRTGTVKGGPHRL